MPDPFENLGFIPDRFQGILQEVSDRKGEPSAGEDRPVGHYAKTVRSQDARRSQELGFRILKLNLEGLVGRDFVFFQFQPEVIIQGQDQLPPFRRRKNSLRCLPTSPPGDESLYNHSADSRLPRELDERKKVGGVFFHHCKHQVGFKASVPGEAKEVLAHPLKCPYGSNGIVGFGVRAVEGNFELSQLGKNGKPIHRGGIQQKTVRDDPHFGNHRVGIQMFQKREEVRLQKGLAAGEVDTGLPAPSGYRAEEVVGDSDKPGKGEIRLFGEILLVAMAAAEVAEIGDVPLDIKRFHRKMVAEALTDGKEEKKKFEVVSYKLDGLVKSLKYGLFRHSRENGNPVFSRSWQILDSRAAPG